ncbi:hypothetical protein ACHAPJ_001526 [Fusarium lateritium]
MDTLQNVYNSLGDVYEASETVASRPRVLSALANLLVEHKLDNAYDIRLNHKHFDITGSEQVVGFTGHNLIASAVCNGGEMPVEMLSAEGIGPVSGGAIRPSDFLVKGGIAIPYEFAYTASTPSPAPSPQFLDEWCTILREEGVDGLLGLSVRDDNVPVDAHEVSDSEARINRLFFQDARAEGMPVVSTTWRVHKVNGIVEAKQCTYCNAIRRHGNKC